MKFLLSMLHLLKFTIAGSFLSSLLSASLAASRARLLGVVPLGPLPLAHVTCEVLSHIQEGAIVAGPPLFLEIKIKKKTF